MTDSRMKVYSINGKEKTNTEINSVNRKRINLVFSKAKNKSDSSQLKKKQNRLQHEQQ